MQKESIWQRQLFWGIKVWQIFACFCLYAFFAFQYWFAIWYTSGKRDNLWADVSIDNFFLKVVLTLPLWWLYFVKLKSWSLGNKLLLHLITAPTWIFLWFHGYRFLQDLRGAFYLKGDGIWWDIYIPCLLYCIQFATFHVYDFYLQTQQQKEREKQLMQSTYNAEMNALKAQIQPHFLFNTLNSISAAVPSNLEHVREMIAQLADTFRYGLQASQEELVPIKLEVDFIKNCLNLEQERFRNRLEVNYKIEKALLEYLMPPMLLQPIVENAVKHGIAKNIEGGIIDINIIRTDNNVKFEIINSLAKDEVVNVSNMHNKGIGLSNTQKRLLHLYNEQINITILDSNRIAFSFKIPLQINKHEQNNNSTNR